MYRSKTEYCGIWLYERSCWSAAGNVHSIFLLGFLLPPSPYWSEGEQNSGHFLWEPDTCFFRPSDSSVTKQLINIESDFIGKDSMPIRNSGIIHAKYLTVWFSIMSFAIGTMRMILTTLLRTVVRNSYTCPGTSTHSSVPVCCLSMRALHPLCPMTHPIMEVGRWATARYRPP